MCGIAALIAAPGRRLDPDVFRRLDARLAHRGPDASGLATFDRAANRSAPDAAEVALIHRRLSIIDLDRRSDQPMQSADGRFVLIYNGEIYNYLELRGELERFGHVFRTTSDSEVLIAAFAQWGEQALRRLTGMFAFVLLDRQAREAVLARDPFGIKPLFWTLTANGLAVGSEIGALLDLPGVATVADGDRAWLFLTTGQTDAGEGTMFAGIRSLPAGHFVRIPLAEPSAPRPVRYWSPTIAQRERPLAVAAQELREAMLQSVGLHLRSDVPVGIALSGGLDSSTILACARKIGGRGLNIRTFSFAADGSEVDESAYIRLAAEAAGAHSTLVRIVPAEVTTDIDRLIGVQGEPFASLSIYAQYRVMGLAAQDGIKVVLDGQGADELFGGYRPFIARRLSQLLAGVKPGAAARLVRGIRRSRGAGGAVIAQAFEPALPRSLRALARRMVGRPACPPWIDRGWFAAKGAVAEPPSLAWSGHFLHDALAQSLTETVLPALLRYEDRNSMAFSIESRVPFLTPAIADLAYSMPAEHLVDRDATSKAVLREAMRGIVPDAILDRRDKIGFATPDRLWSRALTPWFRQVLSSDPARAMPWLDANRAVRVLEGRIDRASEFGSDLWRTISMIRWAERFGANFT